jgi:glycyl-tRNA synthetase beta chain
MTAEDFLIELGCEELPPKSLLTLSSAFADLLSKQLTQHQIHFQHIQAFATPRRLAVLLTQLAAQQPDQHLQKRGPALTAAFNAAGEPTPAALGFAKSCGVNMDALGQLETNKGSWLVYDVQQIGKSTVSLLPPLIATALQQLPIAKRMRWGTRTDSFIRPVKWLLALYGNDVVDMTLFDCRSDRITYGHRVHAPHPITLQHPKDYADALHNQGYVIADFEKRRAFIIEHLRAKAAALKSEIAGLDAISALIDEVTALVEYPQILVGTFESRFLQVPQEALIQTMQDNQKYFALFDQDKNLKPQFLFVSNLMTNDPAQIIQGNEKVIRPRFSDAEFFFHQDQQQPLENFNEPLKALVFQNKLGSVYNKVLRVAKLSTQLANDYLINVDDALCAAMLCKADLATQMVQEMPELQGIMGGYYAKLSGENDSVCQAIGEHYQPIAVDDDIPKTQLGQTIALADKLDTLVSIFAAGLMPTGDKDPFALRRAALGCIRIICESSWSGLALHPYLTQAAKEIGRVLPTIDPADLSEQVWLFVRGRLENYIKQNQIIDTRIFQAVYALSAISDVKDLTQRITIIHQYYHSPDLQALSSANKRVNNLLKKLSLEALPQINSHFFEIDAEKNLYQALNDIHLKLDASLHDQNYSQAITLLSQLRQPVDEFFEQVHVMADDQNLQNNRLALLKLLQINFLKIADLSYLVIES